MKSTFQKIACLAICLLFGASLVGASTAETVDTTERSQEMLERMIALDLGRKPFDETYLKSVERSMQMLREQRGLEPVDLRERWWWPQPTEMTTDESEELVVVLQASTRPRGAGTRRTSGIVDLDVAHEVLLSGKSTCECYCNAACDDGLFCNGAETCNGSRSCQSGASPNCTDTDPCTSDSCNEGTNSCQNLPITPPDEVGTILMSVPNPAFSNAELSWNGQAATNDFNVYLAVQPDLGDLACFSNVTGTSLDDGGILPPFGDVYHFLVTGDGCIESSLGRDWDGVERVNIAPCP